MKKFFITVDDLLGKAFRVVSTICFLTVLLLFLYTVFLRILKPFFPVLPTIHGSSEISEICLVWGTFIAAAELCRTNQHIVVDFLVEKLSGSVIGKCIQIVTALISVAMGAVIIWGAWVLISRTSLRMVYLPFSKGISYACIPVTGAMMIVGSVKQILKSVSEIIRRKEAQ